MAIDITNIVSVTLAYRCKKSVDEDIWKSLCSWMEQARNVRSLEIYGELFEFVTCSQRESFLSILQHQVQHLKLDINDVDQIKIFLEGCENLSRLKFYFNGNISKKIKQWFNDSTVGSICLGEHYSVSVWLGKLNIQCTLFEKKPKRAKVDSSS